MEHIQGVTQLNELLVTGRIDAIVLLFFGLLCFFVGAKILHDTMQSRDLFLVFVPIALIIFAGILFVQSFNFWNHTQTRYQVVVEDTVSFNQFHDTYRILQIDGDIYTVLPK